MSPVSATPLALFMIVGLTAALFGTADANGFLHANPRQEHMSEEDVQSSLLAEVESAFGEGSASSRVKQFEDALTSIYAALPKNEHGNLGHATVHYALHRVFVQRHGWVIKGLSSGGGHRNSTSGATLLKEQVPAYIQNLFEKRLGSRGMGLREVATFAATIEHLIHNEAIARVGSAFKIHDLLPTDVLSVSVADDLLDTYMTAFIHGEDLSKMTLEEALALKAEMPEVYVAWNETKDFLRSVRHDTVQSDGSPELKASGDLDFSLVARVAERVSEKYGKFQDTDCHKLKADLVKMEEKGTGRVRLSDFYRPALNGNWQFQESAAYLRQLGAMDDSTNVPRVIIANYVGSPTNCIAASNFYSMCCIDECEGLLGHLERQIASPEASPTRIAALISELSSSSIIAPRKLSQALLDRLGEIAATHAGTIPLHGRLFAQWMHHAYPLECPYPHISGTTVPLSPNEWLESTGEEASATDEQMQEHVDLADALKVNRNEDEEKFASLPWATEEELLVARPAMQSDHGVTRNAIMFMVMASVAFGMIRSAFAPRVGASKVNGFEKYLV